MAARDRRAFLHLAGCLPLHEKATVVPWERELVAPQKIADHLFVVRRGGATRLEHVESLASWKPRDIEEIILRAMLISTVPELRRYNIQTTVVIALPRDLPRRLPPEFRRLRGALRTYLDIRYRMTWEIPGRELLDLRRVSVLPLLPLTRHDRAELMVAAERLKREGDEELISQLLVNMAYVYDKKEVKEFEMLFAKETREIAEMTWVGRDLIAKGRKEGNRRGLARGRQEGVQTGIQAGLAEAVRMMAEARFPDIGPMPGLVEVRDQETANRLIVEITKARTREQVRRAVAGLVPARRSKQG